MSALHTLYILFLSQFVSFNIAKSVYLSAHRTRFTNVNFVFNL